MKNTIQAVIFDMDGVVFDTERLWKEGFYLMNEKYHLPFGEDVRKSICGKSEPEIRKQMQALYPAVNVDLYRDGNAAYVDDAIREGKHEVKAGFPELAAFLRQNGYKTALATSSPRERSERMFAKKGLEIAALFDRAVFAEDVGSRCKPDPFVFLLAAERLGVLPENCMVIEDSLNGIRAAVRGGFCAVMAEDLTEPDDFCLQNATICQSLFEVLAVLQKQNG